MNPETNLNPKPEKELSIHEKAMQPFTSIEEVREAVQYVKTEAGFGILPQELMNIEDQRIIDAFRDVVGKMGHEIRILAKCVELLLAKIEK